MKWLPPEAVLLLSRTVYGHLVCWEAALSRDQWMANASKVRASMRGDGKCTGPTAAAIVWLLRANGHDEVADRIEGIVLTSTGHVPTMPENEAEGGQP